MNGWLKTVFFWTVWGGISFWALKTFYYSFSKDKLERLREAAIGVSVAVLILTILPWSPDELGGKSGLWLAVDGNALAMVFVVSLVVSTVLFLTRDTWLWKWAAAATITNSVILFTLMYTLRPGTFGLTLSDIAPIVAVLLLLVGDVVGLLLWQQLQLKDRRSK